MPSSLARRARLIAGAASVIVFAAIAPGAAGAAIPSTAAGTYATDGPVNAITTLGDTVYLGGSFSNVGVPTGRGAEIDATTGAVDRSVPAVVKPEFTTGSVNAVISDGSGGYYVGGNFDGVGSFHCSGLVHILANKTVDTAFCPLGGFGGGGVLSLAKSGSTLYVGGAFNELGGQPRQGIGAVNATTGNATSFDPEANGPVYALAVSGSTVYAGGEFGGPNSIGGADRNGIAALNGATGNATSWNPNASGPVYSLLVDGSTVYAGGAFSGSNSIGGEDRNHVAALDRTTGEASSFNPDANGNVLTMALSGSTLYAGGDFSGTNSIGGADRNHIAAIDTSTGNATSFDPNASGSVYTIALSGSTLYAGGAFQGTSSIGGADRDFLAALDASTGNANSWDPKPDDTVGALAASGSTVYAGGEFSMLNLVPRHNLAALDQDTGDLTGWDPGTDGDVNALAAHGSTVYAGGAFSSAGGQGRHGIAAFDATTGDVSSFDPEANAFVRALAVSDDGSTVYAGGFFSGTDSIGGQDRNYIAALDSSTGAATSWNPNANDAVWTITVDGSTIYAGGDFNGTNSIGGQDRNRIAALDATTGNATAWNPNSDGRVRDIAVAGSDVYVAGENMSTIGGQPRSDLADIDKTTGNATSWTAGVGNSIYALAVDSQTVYTAGSFTLNGFTRATGSPTSFGPDPSGDGYALALTPTALYAGGSFTSLAGGRGSHFAAFVDTPTNTVVPTVTGTPVSGKTLTCHKGTWTGPTPQTYAYQWLRSGAAIAGATSATYLLKAADAGKQIRCRVTASNLGGSTAAQSAAVTIKTPPKNTVAPKITGTPKVGKTLTCAKGTWTGSAPITYKYQWLRNASPIAGATAATYVAKAADLNKMISCKVTATNAAGTANKTSAAVKVT